MINLTSSIQHHVEICLSDERPILKLLSTGLGFSLSHVRFRATVRQWVFSSHAIVFIVTKKLNPKNYESFLNIDNDSKRSLDGSKACEKYEDEYPFLFCCDDRKLHSVDTVFNVAFSVRDVEGITRKIKLKGGGVIREPYAVSDKNGTLKIAVVKSKCPNVIHSLIDRSQYNNDFLPGFTRTDQLEDFIDVKIPRSEKLFTTYCDHVTFVCNVGESKGIIAWYEECFGMDRFFTNKDESVEEGFVLDGSIGLRLKAMEYWRCAERGVRLCGDRNSSSVLKFVIAEPLPGSETSHVAKFLNENGGQGVQHIGLSCENIVQVVKVMKERGVQFRTPPSTYYEECGDLETMVQFGLAKDVEELKSSGILIDNEEQSDSNGALDQNRYLMQIFTHPIFKEDTFFFEVIQRFGATGFGSGNITALARSIVKYQEECKKKSQI